MYVITEKMEKVNALLQLNKANWNTKSDLQSDYLTFMTRRAWVFWVLVLLIFILQVFAIHRVFDRSQASTRTVQYRMKV